MFPRPAHMPHLRPGIRPTKEQAAPIEIGTAMMNDALRRAVVDTDEFCKAGKTNDQCLVDAIIEPICATASERSVIAARIAMLLELDRRYKRLSFEGDHGAIEAVDDPALHTPGTQIGFQPVDWAAPGIRTPRAALRRPALREASSLAGRSGRYSHSDSAPDNPGAPARLPRSR